MSTTEWHLPPDVSARVKDRDRFEAQRREYAALSLAELHRRTACYQHNMPLARAERHDYRLRVLVVPELWERLVDGARTPVRRLSETILEYDFSKPSIFARMRLPAVREAHRAEQQTLREEVGRLAQVGSADLRDVALRAISEAALGVPWEPEAFVYDVALYCRVVPELIARVPADGSGSRPRYEDMCPGDARPRLTWDV